MSADKNLVAAEGDHGSSRFCLERNDSTNIIESCAEIFEDLLCCSGRTARVVENEVQFPLFYPVATP
jgi:hypothetical protein